MRTKIEPEQAREMLRELCGGVGRDYRVLSYHSADALHDSGKSYGYRQPRNAPGSYARSFHAYLERIAARAS